MLKNERRLCFFYVQNKTAREVKIFFKSSRVRKIKKSIIKFLKKYIILCVSLLSSFNLYRILCLLIIIKENQKIFHKALFLWFQ